MEYRRRHADQKRGSSSSSAGGGSPYDLDPLFELMHSRIHAELFAGLECLPGKRLLFVGGGIGREISRVKRILAGCVAVNLDVNGPDLMMCLDHFKIKELQCGVVQGDAMAIPFRDGSFDAVVLYNSIHHMDDQSQCLRECFRVAGMIFIADRKKCLISRVGRFLGMIRSEEDGLYANEVDMSWLCQFVLKMPGGSIVALRYHFLYLLFINRDFHSWMLRHPAVARSYISLVKVIDRIAGPLGNGFVAVLKADLKKSGHIVLFPGMSDK